MSITDAISRISQIQEQLAELTAGTLGVTTSATPSASGAATSAAATAGTTGTTATTGTPSTTSTTATPTSTSAAGATDFANALAQAQGTAATDTSSPSLADSEFGSLLGTGATTGLAGATTGLTSATTPLLTGGVGVGTTSGVTLPTTASAQMTTGQQQFAQALAADTGLNPGVVSAWVLSEESGSAAQERQAAGNNDWLNVGYTGSGSYGAADSAWSDPTTAAATTADWMQGQNAISGYGTASPEIQSILQTVGASPQTQISALQDSGWASSGYPDLPELYGEVS